MYELKNLIDQSHALDTGCAQSPRNFVGDVTWGPFASEIFISSLFLEALYRGWI